MALPYFMGWSREPGRNDYFQWTLLKANAASSFNSAGGQGGERQTGIKDLLRQQAEDAQALREQPNSSQSSSEGNRWNVFTPVKLEYVSSLARQVTPSDMSIDYTEENWGVLKFPVPRHIQYTTVKVVYIDDDSGNVFTFHQQWFDAIRCFGPYALSEAMAELMGTSGAVGGKDRIHPAYYNGLGVHSLEPFSTASGMGVLSKITHSVSGKVRPSYTGERWQERKDSGSNVDSDDLYSYIPLSKLEDSDHIPVSVHRTVYPRIFPVKVSQSEYDKMDGSKMTEVTVEYLRIPEFTRNVQRVLGNQTPLFTQNYSS